VAMVGRLAAVAIGLAGCYSPDLSECVRACNSVDDCATGQTCGADGLCASPENAGHCAELAMPDAPAPPGVDAARADARVDARPDAETMAVLRIEIVGRGEVKALAPIDLRCHAYTDAGLVCSWPVPIGVDADLEAKDGHEWTFDSWIGCVPTGAMTCGVTVDPGTTTVEAHFVPD
jgi:hypothetical protein